MPAQPVVATVISKANYVSEQNYFDYYYPRKPKYEWNNGLLEKISVSDFLTFQVHLWFTQLLSHFLTVHPIAQMVGLEMGFRLILPTKKVIRRPDLGIILATNPVLLQPLDRFYDGIFDLCIEFISDSKPKESYRDAVIKRAEYAAGGVAEYYILHHEIDKCAFYTRNSGRYVSIIPQENIISSVVLPGFRFHLRDLILKPSLESMLNDPVYQDFVLPAWQSDQQKIYQAEQRAKIAEAEVMQLKNRLAKQQNRESLN